MKVLITGATGMIGQELVGQCHALGYEVHYLTTRKEKIEQSDHYKGFLWNPIEGTIDTKCFDDVEVIINLAGSTIAKRWTKTYRKEILSSRLLSLNLLSRSLRGMSHSVRHLVSASAIGIYPDSFMNYYTEESTEQDTGFLCTVVRDWEAAADQFQKLNIEVAKIRIGLVLSANGGAYPKMAKPIKMGLGAIFGSGKQWQSWIHVNDVSKIFVHAVREELVGTYNAVAPNAVSNTTLTICIAKMFGKKIRLPGIPKFVMRLLLGKMHILLYGSQRVSSKKIQDSGYLFEFENLKPALEAITKK